MNEKELSPDIKAWTKNGHYRFQKKREKTNSNGRISL